MYFITNKISLSIYENLAIKSRIIWTMNQLSFTPLQLDWDQIRATKDEIWQIALAQFGDIAGLLLREHPWILIVMILAICACWKQILRGLWRVLIEVAHE